MSDGLQPINSIVAADQSEQERADAPIEAGDRD